VPTARDSDCPDVAIEVTAMESLEVDVDETSTNFEQDGIHLDPENGSHEQQPTMIS